MRWMIVAMLAIVPATSQAQISTDPSIARALPNQDALAAAAPTLSATRSSTLVAGSKKDTGPVSKNEAYNIGRAASGRVGIRLGNDMSFPIGR